MSPKSPKFSWEALATGAPKLLLGLALTWRGGRPDYLVIYLDGVHLLALSRLLGHFSNRRWSVRRSRAIFQGAAEEAVIKWRREIVVGVAPRPRRRIGPDAAFRIGRTFRMKVSLDYLLQLFHE